MNEQNPEHVPPRALARPPVSGVQSPEAASFPSESAWNRECVVCGYKWRGDENSICTMNHAPEAETPSMLALIDRYVRDPSIDVERLERLLAMKERLDDREAETAFNEALSAAQEEIQPIARTTENKVTHSFYAKLEEVDAAIRPIYLRHGFSLSYSTVTPLVPGNIRVECRCARRSHVERFYREARPDTLGPKGTPTKTELHGAASTETFLKRYLACGIFNVVFKDMDDDGTGGTIDEAQAKHIRELLAKALPWDPNKRSAQEYEASFLKLIARAPTVEQIPYRLYLKCVSTLEDQTRDRGAQE